MNNFIYNLNGDLLVFGYNRGGQLGLGHNDDIIVVPTLLMNDESIRNIICGKYHPKVTLLIQ